MNVKICGLITAEAVAAASKGGARYIGFNFFPRSPRYAAPDLVRDLAADAPPGVVKVALAVDPDDALLDEIAALPIDMIQLHGGEPPSRVAEAKAKTGLPVMKVVGVAEKEDLAALDDYAEVADQLMVDAKPPKGGALPGGNGVAFDWRLVANRAWTRPWMLAGGLTADNVAAAIALTGARQVDVASGVESAPGVKDPAMIRAFLAAARTAA
ncbi:MAG: phosphoribosylanthranilate isomerase [Pseudomonadota bacterium]